MATKKIIVVGDQLLSLGMKLSGIKETHSVNKGEETETLLRKLFERNDIGVLIIGESFADSVKDRRIRYKLENSIDPVVMQVPGYNEGKKSDDSLRRLIMRAVGIDIVNTEKAKK